MPVPKLKLTPGYFYHIFNRAVQGSLLFREDKNYAFFLSKVQKYLLQTSDILAYCLMPNHFHLLVKIQKDGFSESMQKLALSYVVSFNKTYKRQGHLFQGPYQKIHIKDLNYLFSLSQYIHLNPQNANLVYGIADWEYSSTKEFIGERPISFIKPMIILDLVSEDISSTLAEQQKAYLQSLTAYRMDNRSKKNSGVV